MSRVSFVLSTAGAIRMVNDCFLCILLPLYLFGSPLPMQDYQANEKCDVRDQQDQRNRKTEVQDGSLVGTFIIIFEVKRASIARIDNFRHSGCLFDQH
jgi:hypothetical protein